MYGLRPGIAASTSIGRRPGNQTSQAPFANDRTHQLRVPQLQDSQDSFATYNLYTYTSTKIQHGSFLFNLNHTPYGIVALVPARPTITPLTTSAHSTVSSLHQHPMPPSTTGAAPDSSLVCSIVIVSLIVFRTLYSFREAWPGSAMAMRLHCVTPEAELLVDLLFSSDVEVDMDARLSSLERFRCSEIHVLQQPGIIVIESQEPTIENIELYRLVSCHTKKPYRGAKRNYHRLGQSRHSPTSTDNENLLSSR